MSDNSIARPRFAAPVHPGFEHSARQLSSDEKPVYTRAGREAVPNRDAGPVASIFSRARFRRGGDDEVFHPNNSSHMYASPSGVAIGARVPPVVNGQVATIERHARERLLLGLPATLRYIPPYEVQVPNGRVFVSPLRALEAPSPRGTVVTTAMDPDVRYF